MTEPRATQLFPILATPDIDRSLRFYGDLLGGVVSYTFPGADAEPVYVGVKIGESYIGIGLERAVNAGALPRAISLWVYTDDCDALVERLRAAGITISEEPADQPWGERIARVLDPDGNEVIIGQRAAD
jgi:lactoylglutathione lyase